MGWGEGYTGVRPVAVCVCARTHTYTVGESEGEGLGAEAMQLGFAGGAWGLEVDTGVGVVRYWS